MKLVIVESPTKAKTISKFLDKDYKVLSSYGHIRDLPTGKLGVDTNNDFKPDYIIPPKAKKNVNLLKAAGSKADSIILATDEDREGEAIAFHLKHILSDKKKNQGFQRITFHEITPNAIKEALKNPREIDLNLFDAQQARRILDRLVGYELSPFLWKKIRKGLSAGRVQSVAVRLIVEKEREREKFESQEFWKIKSLWTKKEKEIKPKVFLVKNENREINEKIQTEKEKNKANMASLVSVNGKKIGKTGVPNEEEANKILKNLEKNGLKVSKIEKKDAFRYPTPPFRTSTMQQEAGRRLGFSAKRTMLIAQQLYEGIKVGNKQIGLITYMRTDSLNISKIAIDSIRKYVKKEFGENYLPKSPRFFKQKAKGAQEAHEAIRPSFPEKSPDELSKYLSKDQFKLYKLIWERTVASQMVEAKIDVVNVTFQSGDCELLSQGVHINFDGFFRVAGSGTLKEEALPELEKNEVVSQIGIVGEQNFTKPPARYTEATLIKTLEENGIGRPSTYAPTISTIQDRGYVSKDEKGGLFPEEIGFIVNDILVEHFPNIVEIKFTAQVEEDLDGIASGSKKWVPVISKFYSPFKENLKKKEKEVKKFEKVIEKSCPECGKPMVEKFGRFGKFYACSGFPDCKHTEGTEEQQKLEKEASKEKCPECGSPLQLRRSKWGMFMGCSNYPNCKYIKKMEKKLGIKCPQCGEGEIIEKKSRRGPFFACNRYPDCQYIAKGRPSDKKCPKCGQTMMKYKKEEKCLNPKCAEE